MRRLLHERGRAKSGRVLVEGKRSVRTVLAGTRQAEYVLAGPKGRLFLNELPKRAEVPVYALSRDQVQELCGTAHSQEIFAVVAWSPHTGAPEHPGRLVLHLSGIRNPVNMGALLRTAAAFGVVVTCSPDCVDVTHPDAVRGGAASYFDLPLFVNVPLDSLRKPGTHRVAYASARDGENPTNVDWSAPTILVLGGEAEGATESVSGAVAVHLPVRVESLNAAVAGGIMMWEATKGKGV